MSALCQKRTHSLRQYPPNLIASCYPEATPYEFLSAMEIEARAATKRNRKLSYATQVGVGEFVASLRLLSWAARRGDEVPPSAA